MALQPPQDPYTAAFGAAAGVATAAMQKPNQTQGNMYDLGGFDNSGWAVNIGSGTASPVTTRATGGGAAGPLAMLGNPIVVAALVLGVFLLVRE